MIELSDKGLYCPAGDFYIDPWRPVDKAVLTHAHADHARSGSAHYFAHLDCEPILRHRLGKDIVCQTLTYDEPMHFKDVQVSLHSAGHILGSAQVRVEHKNQVWVVTGDFKRQEDPTCEPFESLVCDTLITEATFASPIYRWPSSQTVAQDIYAWWQRNARDGKASVLFTYSLGKAQRVLALLKNETDQAIYVHSAIEALNAIYRKKGIQLAETKVIPAAKISKKDFAGQLILAPPGADRATWVNRFGDCKTGFCSGWMSLRGNRRRRGYDRGFVLSDHADWPALLQTIEESGAQLVLATHGRTDVLVRYLNERGHQATALKTYFSDGDDSQDMDDVAVNQA